MSAFEDHLPDLIADIGAPQLMTKIDAALRLIAPFDLSCVFAYPAGAAPQLLYDDFRGAATRAALDHYFAGAYLLDCVYSACKKQTLAGLYRLAELAPDAFFEGEYYNNPEVHPCISMEKGSLAEEIVFLVPLNTGTIAAYSIMRSNGREPFSAQAFDRLKAREPMLRALIQRHYRDVETLKSEPGEGALEPTFDSFRADILSARERVIASLVLQGHSSTSIGLNLGIAEGTVKIHRKNLYAKLNISSQAELFALFLKHLRMGKM
jgi:DNA-binding CsgD family transcriptional regulator